MRDLELATLEDMAEILSHRVAEGTVVGYVLSAITLEDGLEKVGHYWYDGNDIIALGIADSSVEMLKNALFNKTIDEDDEEEEELF